MFENGPGGGIDDLNELCDQDLFKNHLGHRENRFHVRNRHVPPSSGGDTKFSHSVLDEMALSQNGYGGSRRGFRNIRFCRLVLTCAWCVVRELVRRCVSMNNLFFSERLDTNACLSLRPPTEEAFFQLLTVVEMCETHFATYLFMHAQAHRLTCSLGLLCLCFSPWSCCC